MEPTTQNTKESELALVKSQVEIYSKVLAFIIGGLYGIGILIVNTYQYELGISEFPIIDFKYIYSGTLFIFFSIFFLLIPALFLSNKILYIQKESSTFRKVFEVFRAIMLLSMPLIVSYFFLFFSQKSGSIFIDYSSYVLIFVMYITSFPFVYYLIRLLKALDFFDDNILPPRIPIDFRKSKTLNIYLKYKWFRITMLGKICAIFFGIYLMTFSLSIYSVTPEQFGGGKPKPMVLIFNKKNCEDVRSKLFPNLQDCQTEPLHIIYETKDYFIIRKSFKDVIKIRREVISSIKLGGYLSF